MKEEELNILRDGLSVLQPGDRGLVLTYLQRGNYNHVQESYLRECLEVVKKGIQNDLFDVPSGIYGKLRWHFDQARKYLTFPKIKMRDTFLDAGLVLSLAGKGSKQPGTILITDGGSFGKSANYGRITAFGDVELNPATLSGDEAEIMTQILTAMTTDLSSFARNYYHQRHRCMFTDDELHTKVEKDFGYTRVTGMRWGLSVPVKQGESSH